MGEGVTDRPNTLLEAIKLLKDNSIPVSGFHTRSFRTSLLINNDHLQKALDLLHSAVLSSE